MLKEKKQIRESWLTMWPPMGDEEPRIKRRMVDYRNVPRKLRQRRQWVVWRIEKDKAGRHAHDKGHDLVVYYHPTSGQEADPQDSRTWGSCRQAERACSKGEYDGVAYVFLPEDPIVGVFINDCVKDARPTGEAWDVIRCLDSYTEFFVDERSMLVIVEGALPEEEYHSDNIQLINAGFCPISTWRFRPYSSGLKQVKKRQKGVDTLIENFFTSPDDQAQAQPARDAENLSEPLEDPSRALAEQSDIQKATTQENAPATPKQSQKATIQENAPAAPEGSQADNTEPATSTNEELETQHIQEINDLFELALTGLDWKKLAGRARAIDHRAYFVILDLMRSAKSDTIHLSSRHLAEMAGITSRTASKVLRRLQRYGLLTLVAESDYYKKAHVYRLVSADSIKHRLAQYLLDEPKEPINVETLIKYAGHDAFLHGANLLIDGHYTLGPSALEVLCALIAELEKYYYSNIGLHFAEIARRTGLSSATVSQKAKALQKLGLVTIRKEGRRKIVRLINLSTWEDLLEQQRHLLSTDGKAQARKEKHAQERKKHLRKGKRDARP